MITEALIIFTKNPVPGKVKTRLAATVGNDVAFSVYQQLVKHTSVIQIICIEISNVFAAAGNF